MKSGLIPAIGYLNQMISFEEGIRNAMEYALTKSTKRELTFEDIKPAVRLIGKGVISPSSQGLILPFEAVSLKAVDVRVVEIFENNVHQFLQDNKMGESGNIRRVARLILQKRIDWEPIEPLICANGTRSLWTLRITLM